MKIDLCGQHMTSINCEENLGSPVVNFAWHLVSPSWYQLVGGSGSPIWSSATIQDVSVCNVAEVVLPLHACLH